MPITATASTPKSTMLGESGYARKARDAYFTPVWVTRTFLDAVPLRGAVWEPADGEGAISGVLREAGYTVARSDVHDYGLGAEVSDFLTAAGLPSPQVRSIVTNPPYGPLAERFAVHALELTRPVGGMVALLLRNEYASALKRSYLFERYPFAMKGVLTSRPHWTEERKKSPRHNFAWFVWDWAHEGPATMRLLHRPPSDRAAAQTTPPVRGAPRAAANAA